MVYFERQYGALCARHALNAVLQHQAFTEIDLATIALDLDDQERVRMLEAGTWWEAHTMTSYHV